MSGGLRRWSSTSASARAHASVLAGGADAAAREDALAGLAEQLDALDQQLDEMHRAARLERERTCRLCAAEAAARGADGLGTSPADYAANIAAPLRAYEAELAFARSVAAAVCAPSPPPPAEVQALLTAWGSQPMLEPLDAMLRGAESAWPEGRTSASRAEV